MVVYWLKCYVLIGIFWGSWLWNAAVCCHPCYLPFPGLQGFPDELHQTVQRRSQPELCPSTRSVWDALQRHLNQHLQAESHDTENGGLHAETLKSRAVSNHQQQYHQFVIMTSFIWPHNDRQHSTTANSPVYSDRESLSMLVLFFINRWKALFKAMLLYKGWKIDPLRILSTVFSWV